MNENGNHGHSVLLAMQNALLGEIDSNLRAVVVEFDSNGLRFDAYFDGQITEENRESMSLVETELLASLPDEYPIDYEVHRLDSPTPVPKYGIWVYYRKEPLS